MQPRDRIRLRHMLDYGYDSVDMDILWRILTRDVPDLVRILRSIPDVQQL